tara:strand:- start:298 stop:1005 length:708 start_codon:yes stop_codon:yes gene_type:complete
MKKVFCFLILMIPFITSSQTRIRFTGFTEYDAWTHLDPFYLDEPAIDADNFRPVNYEERVTEIKLTIDSPLVEYWIGEFGAKIMFAKGWSNRKHTEDNDGYFEQTWPMTPYQTESDYIDYAVELYYGFPFSNIKPFIGFGGDLKIEQISSLFIDINEDVNAASDPIGAIPVDEHIEKRLGYYIVGGVDCIIGRYLYIAPHIKLYINEIEINKKMNIEDRTSDAQLRPGIEIGFIF